MSGYYKVLGLNRDASSREVRKAYRKLALKSHPDVNSSSKTKEDFILINEAYQVLKDARKRNRYDLSLNSQNAKSSSKVNRSAHRGQRKAQAYSKVSKEKFKRWSFWNLGWDALGGLVDIFAALGSIAL